MKKTLIRVDKLIIFSSLFITFSFVVLVLGASYSDWDDSVYEDGLVLWYHLNNDSSFGENDTHIYDFSGNGNNGTITGSPVFNLSSGAVYGGDGALEFDGDGVSGEVNSGNSKELNLSTNGSLTSDYTISVWVNPLISGDFARIIEYGGFTNGGYSLQLTSTASNSIVYYYGDNSGWGGSTSEAPIPYTRGEWMHLVVVAKDTRWILYKNGVLQINKTAPIYYDPDTSRSFKVGEKSFNGTIDEIMIFNKSLSTTEVEDLYEQQNDNCIVPYQGMPTIKNITFCSNDDSNTEWFLVNGISPNVTSNMVAHLKFNNDSSIGENDTFAVDYLGNFNVTINGSTFLPNCGILGDGCYEFDGINDSMQFDRPIFGNDTINHTICAWTEQYTISGTKVIIGQLYGSGWSGRSGSMIIGSDKKFYYYILNTTDDINIGGLARSGALTYNDSISHFVCGSWDGEKIRVFVDGILEASQTYEGTSVNDSATSLIGRQNDFTKWLNGTIDEITIFNKSLSLTEIQEMYKNYNPYYYYYNDNVSMKVYPRMSANAQNITLGEKWLNNFGNVEITYSNNTFRPVIGGIQFISDSGTEMGANVASYATIEKFKYYNYDITSTNDLNILYTYTIEGQEVNVSVDYEIEADYLKVKLFSNSNKSFGIRFTKTGNEGQVGIPSFYTHDPWLNFFKVGTSFYSLKPDLFYSSANSFYYSSPTNYQNYSSLSHSLRYVASDLLPRRNLNETYEIRFSNSINNLFTGINISSPSSNIDYMNNKTIFQTTYYTYFTDLNVEHNHLYDWSKFGFNDIVHEYWNFGYPHPDNIPPSYRGGIENFTAAIQDLATYEYEGIPYTIYGDMYSTASYYEPSQIIVNNSGGTSLAWTCGGGCESWFTKFPYQYNIMFNEHSKIKDAGAVGWRLDVMSRIPWGNTIDFNHTQNGVYEDYNDFSSFNGTIRYNYLWVQKMADYTKDTLGLWSYSESGMTNWAGTFDAQLSFYNKGLNYIPSYYFDAIEPYSRAVSTPFGDYFTPYYSNDSMRNYAVDSILRNNIVSVSTRSDTFSISDKERVNIYYLVHAIQKEYLNSEISNVTYYNQSDWISLSELFIQDDILFTNSKQPIVREEYENGLKIYTNKNQTGNINISYNGVNWTLYPNNTIAWNDNSQFFEYIGRINGVNVSIVESKDYVYIQTDGDYNHNFTFGRDYLYAKTLFNFSIGDRDYTNISTLNNLTVNNETVVLYRLGDSYQIKYNASTSLVKQAELYSNDSTFMDRNILGNVENVLKNNLDSTINVSIYGVTGVFIYLSNGSVHQGSDNINITLESNQEAWIYNNWNETINTSLNRHYEDQITITGNLTLIGTGISTFNSDLVFSGSNQYLIQNSGSTLILNSGASIL